ncbi:MAG TPA: helical backbone metal receptor [Gemmatimonadales bacterium]|nr:helical backbone metal receptor [Gemmatimonadales bacterium]
MGTLRRALHLLPFLAAVACAPAPAGRGPLVGVDDAGDTVRLARPALRVVSLIPASTELLFAIGAGPQVVGRTRWCDYPAAAAAVPDVGDGMTPSLEAIAARRPDLVVLYLSGTNADVAARLRALGVPVVQLRTDLLESVPRHARLLGALTGRAAAADSVVRVFEADLAAASDTLTPTAARPTVLDLAWDQPPIAIGRGSFQHELLVRAGARNIFDDLPQASAPVSIEAVVARDPRFILTTGDSLPAFATRPEWQVVPAVRERRFVRVHGSEFDRPGPRSPAAIRTLRAALRAAAR